MIIIILLISFLIAIKTVQVLRKYNLTDYNNTLQTSKPKTEEAKLYYNGVLYNIN